MQSITTPNLCLHIIESYKYRRENPSKVRSKVSFTLARSPCATKWYVVCAKELSEPGVLGMCAMAPPDFGRSVNPISARRADYAHHITTCPSGFSDLPTALTVACVRG